MGGILTEQCDVSIEKRRRVWSVCGRPHDGKQHYNGMTPHKSESILGIHTSHAMTLAAIDGLICVNCDAYSETNELLLKVECPGPSNRKKAEVESKNVPEIKDYEARAAKYSSDSTTKDKL